MFCIISAGTEPGHLITRPEITSYVEVGMWIFKLKKEGETAQHKGIVTGRARRKLYRGMP